MDPDKLTSNATGLEMRRSRDEAGDYWTSFVILPSETCQVDSKTRDSQPLRLNRLHSSKTPITPVDAAMLVF